LEFAARSLDPPPPAVGPWPQGMRVLFDHGTPSGIAAALAEHEVTEARQRGWDRISNPLYLPWSRSPSAPHGRNLQARTEKPTSSRWR
jgi:hypothetical protein